MDSAVHLPGASEERNEPSRIPVPKGMPRKGILKRSSSFGQADSPRRRATDESDDTVFPLRTEPPRYTPPRAAPISGRAASSPSAHLGSQIPKLSVTWWETKSACDPDDSYQSWRSAGRRRGAPAASVESEECCSDDDDLADRAGGDEDDASSVGSSASAIAGHWWFGKSTRFVPHCHRRHMSADGGANERYLTPTQRKSREIADLKRQLRQSQHELADKDAHLTDLRGRLDELESVIGGNTVTESHKLMQRLRQMEATHADELARTRDKCEQRIRLLQRTMAQEERERAPPPAPPQTAAKDVQVDDADSGISMVARAPTSDAAVGTSDDEAAAAARSLVADFEQAALSQSQQEAQAYAYECVRLRSRVAELEYALKQFEDDLLRGDSCANRVCITKRRETTAQLQAFKNECLVWRTKAAEFEILYKAQLRGDEPVVPSNILSPFALGSPAMDGAAANQAEVPFDPDHNQDHYRDECVRLQAMVVELKQQIQMQQLAKEMEVQRLSEEADDLCSRDECVDAKQRLVECESLCDELTLSLADEEKKALQLADCLAAAKCARADAEARAGALDERLVRRTAEYEALHLTLERMQATVERSARETEELRERGYMLENTLMDAGIGLSSAERRRSSVFVDPDAFISHSKLCQTDLTSESMQTSERDFTSLDEKLRELQRLYGEEKSDLRDRLAEIQQNLDVKSSLIGTLTARIQSMNDEFELGRDAMDNERKDYLHKLTDLAAVANRVPLLEDELERTQNELTCARRELSGKEETILNTMESSFHETLKQQQGTVELWRHKLAEKDRQLEHVSAKLDKAEKTAADARMRLSLEKVELEERLSGAYAEVAELHERVYVDKADKGVTARVDVSSRSVSAVVVGSDRSIDNPKGELVDETEEQLKLVHGELLTTRRQVEVLQEKLVETSSVRDAADEAAGRQQQLEAQLEALRAQLQSLKLERSAERDVVGQRKRRVEEERARAEDGRIVQLQTEFDKMRTELDDVIRRYESEKIRMRERILQLEAAAAAATVHNTEREIVSDSETALPVNKRKKSSGVGLPSSEPQTKPLRRCISLPDAPKSPTAVADALNGSCALLRLSNKALRKEIARLNAELTSLRTSLQRAVDRKKDLFELSRKADTSTASVGSRGGSESSELAEDLKELRMDLEGILQHMDVATVPTRFEPASHQLIVPDSFKPLDKFMFSKEPTATSSERERTSSSSRDDDEELVTADESITPAVAPTLLASSPATSRLDQAVQCLIDSDENNEVQLQDDLAAARLQVSALEVEVATLTRLLDARAVDAKPPLDGAAAADDCETLRRQFESEKESLIKQQERDRQAFDRKLDRLRRDVVDARERNIRLFVPAGAARLPQLESSSSDDDAADGWDATDTTIETASEMRRFDSSFASVAASWELESFATARRTADRSPAPPPLPLRRVESEPFLRVAASQTAPPCDEREVAAEKELAMVNRELQMCRDAYARELDALAAERDDLRRRLHEAVLVAEQVTQPADLTTALATADRLQQMVDELHGEVESREKDQQEMFLAMFRKGQETARAELVSAGAEAVERRVSSGSYAEPATTAAQGIGARFNLSEDQVALRFLRDAVYYFLMNRDQKDHLQAIMSLLDFSPRQREAVRKLRGFP